MIPSEKDHSWNPSQSVIILSRNLGKKVSWKRKDCWIIWYFSVICKFTHWFPPPHCHDNLTEGCFSESFPGLLPPLTWLQYHIYWWICGCQTLTSCPAFSVSSRHTSNYVFSIFSLMSERCLKFTTFLGREWCSWTHSFLKPTIKPGLLSGFPLQWIAQLSIQVCSLEACVSALMLPSPSSLHMPWVISFCPS